MPEATRDQVSDLRSWRGAVRGALLGFDVECRRPERFRGSVARHDLDGTSLVAMTAKPHRAIRERAHVSADDETAPDYLLSLQLDGHAEFRQDGRRGRVGPGDLVFYDSSRPVEITSGGAYRSLCFRFPRTRLGDERVDELTATTFAGSRRLTPAVAGLLTGLHTGLEQPGPPRAALAAAVGHATELARTLLDDELTRRGLVATADPHDDLRARVDAHIDAHLADPDLTPGTIAAALFVSTRHLHGLMAADGRTVAATVRRRRLQRCLADLADPRDAATPVSAVAIRWGFTNATRFGQLVKQETGRTPVAYRRAMLAAV